MKILTPIDEVDKQEREMYGGKAISLAIMVSHGINIPPTYVLSGEIYRKYIEETGLDSRIGLILAKKPLKSMRWEEVWDISMEIRNLFLRTKIPVSTKGLLEDELSRAFKKNGSMIAVRSSSAFEDSAEHSFAGLHESFIGISLMPTVTESLIFKKIRLVWASLWSSNALIYRNELKLDVESANMAVIVQKTIHGSSSGLLFCKDPMGKNHMIMEAVYGLNEALVDGSLEPDRWIFDRKTKELLDHQKGERSKKLVTGKNGNRFVSLSDNQAALAPLNRKQRVQLLEIGTSLEKLFGTPQDIEWTFSNGEIVILQSRPITTVKKDARGFTQDGDEREWYMSLIRSFKNLESLKEKVEGKYFTEMEEDAKNLRQIMLMDLSDRSLADELQKRKEIYDSWKDTYWEEFIPLAHGIRLFGKIYNEVVEPTDPNEYTKLLAGEDLLSTKRNQGLITISQKIRKNPALKKKIRQKDFEASSLKDLIQDLEENVVDYSSEIDKDRDMEDLLILALELSKKGNLDKRSQQIPSNSADSDKDANRKELEEKFLQNYPKARKNEAKEILEMGRVAYKLRDDDNIYFGKIEKEYTRILKEAKERLERDKNVPYADSLGQEELVKFLTKKDYTPKKPVKQKQKNGQKFKTRQITGHPASKGVAEGKAHVVSSKKDMFSFKKGEILVCDSIDPNMTFIVPLASGIVERRGGLLVHGAIIAREYNIPCVTGIAKATQIIETGDKIVVDGDFGLVTITNHK